MMITPNLKLDIKIMIEKGLSDAYIQASMWAKYSDRYSIAEIAEEIFQIRRKLERIKK